MGNSTLLQLVQKKNKSEKFPFIATDNLIVLVVWWSVKFFFVPNSPIFGKSREDEGEDWKKTADAKCFAF